MIKLVYFALIASLLFGCVSHQKRRERKAQRKIERARELAPQMFKLDTVIVHDTIIVEHVKVDTITHIRFHDTTVIVNNDRVLARYFYDTTRMEIHHEIECKEIIKPIETRVVVEKFKMLGWFERNFNKGKWLLIIIVIIFLVYRILVKFIF